MGVPLDINGTSLFENWRKSLDSWFSQYSKYSLSCTGYCHLSGSVFQDHVLNREENYTPDIMLCERFGGKIVSLDDYDIIFIICQSALYGYIRYIRSRYPNKIIIGIQDDSLQELQLFDTKAKIVVHDALCSLDGFIAYNTQMKSWMEGFDTNTVLCHHPITKQYIEQIRDKTASIHKQDRICLGITNWNYDHTNFLSNIVVLKNLRKDYPSPLKGEFIGVKDYKIADLNLFASICPDIEILGYLKEDYYQTLKSYKLIIQMGTRAVAGRPCAESAVVGTPMIGTRNADMQEYCWPDISINEFDIAQAITLGKKLLSDTEFYAQICEKAYENLVLLAKDTQLYTKMINQWIADDMSLK